MTQSRLRAYRPLTDVAYASSDTMDTTLVKHPLVVIQTCFNACSVIREAFFYVSERPRRCLPPGEKEYCGGLFCNVNIKPSRRIAAALPACAVCPARRQAMRNRRRRTLFQRRAEGERCFLPFAVLISD